MENKHLYVFQPRIRISSCGLYRFVQPRMSVIAENVQEAKRKLQEDITVEIVEFGVPEIDPV